MKFGGTSVGAPDRLKRVVEIVVRAARTHRVVVIASAASGVTDSLVGLWKNWDDRDEAAFAEALRVRHAELAAAVVSAPGLAEYLAVLEDHLERLHAIFRRIGAEGKTDALYDALIAAGERFSVPLVSLALREAGLVSAPVDAARLIRTDDTFSEANVDLKTTVKQVQRWRRTLAPGCVPVVTGFIGSTPEGATTTLGRGGSDYSAALLACALRASVLERWTDVDGIYTDDPRKNQHATRLASIVLEEAWAWNHAGKLGMHRKALDPLVELGIPVHVRSTATPDLPGTLIVPAGHDIAHAAVG